MSPPLESDFLSLRCHFSGYEDVTPDNNSRWSCSKCCGEHMDGICNRLEFDHWCQVEVLGHSGGIWFLWKDTIDLLVLKTHPQFIHPRVTSVNKQSWFLSIIYGSQNHNLRKFLWHDLNQNVIEDKVPWIAVGDFNSVSSLDETSNPLTVDQRRSLGFNSWIFYHGLFYLGYSRPKCSWTRGNSPHTFKGALLDRALCNTEWSLYFPHARVEILPKLHSDHSLVLINLVGKNAIPPSRLFHFQAAWLTHPGFHKFVKDHWDVSSPLIENNKSLATELQQWNMDHFGIIEKRKKRF